MPGGLKRYVLNVLVGIDQGWNAALGGDPDETISSRVGKASLRGAWFARYVAEPLIDWLFLVLTGQTGHCLACIEWDEGKPGGFNG